MCKALELLGDETFVLERNVNCPSPFLVRLVGKAGYIDKLPTTETCDVYAYGKTFERAAKIALALKRADLTFDYILSHPEDPNAKVILAYQE